MVGGRGVVTFACNRSGQAVVVELLLSCAGKLGIRKLGAHNITTA